MRDARPGITQVQRVATPARQQGRATSVYAAATGTGLARHTRGHQPSWAWGRSGALASNEGRVRGGIALDHEGRRPIARV